MGRKCLHFAEGRIRILAPKRGCCISVRGYKQVDLGERNDRSLQRYSNQAIALATQGRWDEAAKLNRTLLELFPSDVATYNRLGKALGELGEYAQAREAYSKALQLDPQNNIASRNLQRLSYLEGSVVGARADRRRFAPHMFIQESGKTAVVSLNQLASREVLATITVGDEVFLRVDGQRLLVQDAGANRVGEVEPRYGRRLVKLIEGGNKYSAVIGSVSAEDVRVIVQETYRDPSLAGSPSFAPNGAEGAQPFEDRSLVDYSLEDDDDTSYEEMGKEDKEEFILRAGFHEVSPIEEPVARREDGDWNGQTDPD